MTRDLELEARLLVRWCGWRWLRVRERNLCGLFPPANAKDGEWQVSGQEYDESEWGDPVEGVPPPEQRFTDWHRFMPRISIDLAAVVLLKMSLLKAGWESGTRWWPGNVTVQLANYAKVDFLWANYQMGDDPGAAEARAACLAADKIGGT